MSSEIINLMAVRLSLREGGALKLAHMYMFPRRSTYGTFGAPPVGEIYQTEQIFL